MVRKPGRAAIRAPRKFRQWAISLGVGLLAGGTQRTALVIMLLEGDNPEEFLEHTKLELFQDQVFCFTPKGRLIALPRGANAIDFAYAVHTDIGNTCVGCKINGRPMPLITELRNGDEVEIITSDVQAPPSAWQSLAVTGKARSAIRRATRDAARAQYGKLGREILERAFSRRGKRFSEEVLAQALGRLSQKTPEDVIAAVGRGELSSADVIKAAWPEDTPSEAPKRRRKVKRTEEGWFGLGKVMTEARGDDQRCGFVALIGAPNSGKSTLINALVGAKVAIVTQKAQTTRAPVLGIAFEGASQIILVDTPGIFQPKRRLDRAMASSCQRMRSWPRRARASRS